MKINDYASITDSKVRGIVVIKDANGKILVQKENMIVEAGRKFIRDSFLAVALTETGLAYSEAKLTDIAFGGNDNITEYGMTELVSEFPNTRVPLTSGVYTVGTTDNNIKFTASLDRTNKDLGFVLRELGLIITNGATTSLFSRVVFDPIPVAAGEKYTVEYFIYF